MDKEILIKLSSNHNEWVSMVRSFGCKDPEDIVQEMYLRLYQYSTLDKILIGDELNKAFIWVSLRNIFYLSNKNKKIALISLEEVFNVESPIDHIERSKSRDLIEEKIKEEVESWHYYDKMLFNLYRDSRMSMRKLSKETGISVRSIFSTLKNCKERIKGKIGEDYEDYLNEDFELIK
jgi:DNA-directed RNA polymerase specialized sigma24 family protein